jgi:hypothetical protein
VRYHAVHRAWLRSPPAAGVSDAVIGTWVRVSVYAADSEAGEADERVTRHRPLGRARVVGCRRWPRRAWLSACDTTKTAVDAVVRVGLASWNDDDLILDGYDLWGEERTRRIRHSDEDAGGDAGRESGRNSGEDAGEHPAEGRGEEGKEDVGRGIVSEGSEAGRRASPFEDPIPGSPTPTDPNEIDPTPPENKEAKRPERAPTPAASGSAGQRGVRR